MKKSESISLEDERERIAWMSEVQYDIVRTEARGDPALPWAIVLRARSNGGEDTWVRGKSVTRKGFFCAIGMHNVAAGTKRAYKPPVHSGIDGRVCEECVENAMASMEFS